MNKFILSLDQGTSSSRAIIFNSKGGQVRCSQKEFQQHFPRPGWVEHNPADIWESQRSTAAEALAGLAPESGCPYRQSRT